MKARSKAHLIGVAAFVAVVLLSPTGNVEACGPDFEPDVFVNTVTPDDHAAFARGQLGIIQSGFDSNEYAVAFRYLNGGKLSGAELKAYAPDSGKTASGVDTTGMNPDQIYAAQQAELRARRDAQPATRWLNERAKYVQAGPSAQQTPAFPTDYEGKIVFDENYLNCPNPAFENASLTLMKRASTWGKESQWLLDWIHGQDAVFMNCTAKAGAGPAAAPQGSPALLQADRAYQIASATFYSKQFDSAIQQFEAIAKDNNSPWQRWGTYLAGRATVRKAFAMGKITDPYSGDLANFDMDTMRSAQQMLETLLKQPDPAPSRSIVQHELNFIRIRTEPDKRVNEICIALAGPAPDPDFTQDMRDLSWALTKHLNVTNPAPVLAWIEGWRGAGTAATAFGAWQKTGSLPWLIMALAKAGPSDSFVPDLLDSAAKVKPGTPAYDTVFFHRVRLLIALKRAGEARTLLDAALPSLRNQKPSSNLNALLGERLAVARDFNEFLIYAPRTVLSSGSSGAFDLEGQCNGSAHAGNGPEGCPALKQPLEFDTDATTILDQQLPLSLQIEAAKSTSLPPNLREQIAIIAWTRAVLLSDAQSAAKIAPLLPKGLRDTAGSSVEFPADLAILRNPGIRPYLEPGVPRVASFSFFDQFRDNWWCGLHETKDWQIGESGRATSKTVHPSAPAFLSADLLAHGSAQFQRLLQMPDGAIEIGQRVIDYAKDHATDPQVPEALALTVRATHYACESWSSDQNSNQDREKQISAISKAAFQLLHRRYPKSEWTRKTPYYY